MVKSSLDFSAFETPCFKPQLEPFDAQQKELLLQNFSKGTDWRTRLRCDLLDRKAHAPTPIAKCHIMTPKPSFFSNCSLDWCPFCTTTKEKFAKYLALKSIENGGLWSTKKTNCNTWKLSGFWTNSLLQFFSHFW